MSVLELHERSSVATALDDENLYRRVFRALVAVGASMDEAGDALHDAYEQALRHRQPLIRVEGWLFVVAQRRWRRQRLRYLLFRPLDAARRHAVNPIESSGVLAEVRKLPLRQRQVFVARHVLGLNNQETGQVLGMAEGTVSASNHHALRTLRRRLGGEA